jgi:hypothetical protein
LSTSTVLEVRIQGNGGVSVTRKVSFLFSDAETKTKKNGYHNRVGFGFCFWFGLV